MTARFQIPQEKLPTVGQRTFLKVGENFLALFNVNEKLYALDDSCPHQGASLFAGKLEGKTIQCCAHGLKFDLESGFMLNSTYFRVRSYPIEWEGNNAFIIIDSGDNND